MTELRQVDNKQLLKELQNRLHSKQLSEKEIAVILEAEEWKKAYQLADADEERQKEIAEWDRIQAEDED
ncbi:hypothetical protein [endosymbiont GvMRE of Glomus versiforme]|uniref:hypothetical protein n=1 Tax=endosymbiont GvMRE of Glomus versiforme TaxID=2039283 RepID=UPI000ED5D8EA|nr:hypothetical protein [endosymbiont GvMRE of Glomus versiforme]RHZ35751.1 hypothetical protein GvMRE_Ic6g50 [endosymbiont GvMRE of Glomus versiforme]